MAEEREVERTELDDKDPDVAKPEDDEEEEEEVEEEEEEEEIRGGGDGSGGGVIAPILIIVGIVAVAAFVLGLTSFVSLDGIRQELGAKADAADVVREITRLDDAKADRNDLEDVRLSVNTLVEVAGTLNNRVVRAEENLGKNAQVAAAAVSSARKASQLAKEAREQLARLDAESRAWRDSTASTLAGLPREIDSRVRPAVASHIYDLQRSQAAVDACQDSTAAAHAAAIAAFRAELRLSDKDMARLAAKLREREQRRRGR